MKIEEEFNVELPDERAERGPEPQRRRARRHGARPTRTGNKSPPSSLRAERGAGL